MSPQCDDCPHDAPRTLVEWVHAAWQVSKDHGWHDVEGDGTLARVPERIALLHSELSELLEAFRKDPYAPCDKPIALSKCAEEQADVCLRLFDFVAEFQLNAPLIFGRASFASVKSQVCRTETKPSAQIAYLHARLSKLLDAMRYLDRHYLGISAEDHCAKFFMGVVSFAVDVRVDLELAVQVKHAYNVTREHRHGGKAF